jgi:hypothetical protein
VAPPDSVERRYVVVVCQERRKNVQWTSSFSRAALRCPPRIGGPPSEKRHPRVRRGGGNEYPPTLSKAWPNGMIRAFSCVRRCRRFALTAWQGRCVGRGPGVCDAAVRCPFAEFGQHHRRRSP